MKAAVSLQPYNTFGIYAKAAAFITVSDVLQLQQLLAERQPQDFFVLGGGSNMLLTKDINQTVLHIALKGKEVVSSHPENNELLLKVAGGENWHDFVLYLSLIHI